MKKILIIEDDQVLAGALVEHLKNSGYEVFASINGVDGLKVAEEQRPDLILLDIILPIKNGFETLHDLKNNDVTKNIPVINLTNLDSDEDRAKSKEGGAQDFLIKSNTPLNELITKIKSYIPE